MGLQPPPRPKPHEAARIRGDDPVDRSAGFHFLEPRIRPSPAYSES